VPPLRVVNCGRYIHRSRGTELSPHLPDADGHQPFLAWKRSSASAAAPCTRRRCGFSKSMKSKPMRGFCPRLPYIHRSRGTELSPHLPDADGHQPFLAWKRIDLFEGRFLGLELREGALAEAGGSVVGGA
jgi:hypothetical protein